MLTQSTSQVALLPQEIQSTGRKGFSQARTTVAVSTATLLMVMTSAATQVLALPASASATLAATTTTDQDDSELLLHVAVEHALSDNEWGAVVGCLLIAFGLGIPCMWV